MVAGALVDGEGLDEAVLVRRQFGHRRHHAEVVVAVVTVELADLFAVVLDLVGIVIVVRLEELVPVRLARHDHVAQGGVAERLVAHEVDALDAGLGALVDLEDQVDALLRQLDDLGRDGRRDPPRAAVELDDLLGVLLDPSAGEDAARAHGHLVAQLVFLEGVVPLEHHLVDDRVFGDANDQVVALHLHRFIGEQIGAVQRLDRQVELGGVHRVARLDRQVRQDGRGFDALVALHDDPADDHLLGGPSPHGGGERARSRGRRALGRSGRAGSGQVERARCGRGRIGGGRRGRRRGSGRRGGLGQLDDLRRRLLGRRGGGFHHSRRLRRRSFGRQGLCGGEDQVGRHGGQALQLRHRGHRRLVAGQHQARRAGPVRPGLEGVVQDSRGGVGDHHIGSGRLHRSQGEVGVHGPVDGLHEHRHGLGQLDLGTRGGPGGRLRPGLEQHGVRGLAAQAPAGSGALEIRR